MNRTSAGRTRLVTAALVLALTAASCTWEVESPSIRYLPQGDARRYVDGEHHYSVTLELHKSGQGPGEVTTRTTKLALDLRENVATDDGALTQITITVAAATRTDADPPECRPSPRKRPPVRVSGTGTAQIGGSLPTINLARSRTAPPEAQQLSGKNVGLNLTWTFEERLADRWPRDPLPRALVIVAIAVLGVVVIFQFGWALWPSRRRAGVNDER